jgi:hypothetical protein
MRDCALVLEDEFLDRGPSGAAVLLGPVAGKPAAAIEDRLPFLVVGLAEVLAGADLFSHARGKLFGEEAPHFAAERFLFGSEVQIHGLNSQ